MKLAQSTQKFKEAKEEGEQIRADCQAMIKKYQVDATLILKCYCNKTGFEYQEPLPPYS